jgi:polar amino acid transport system substrate-binding protein
MVGHHLTRREEELQKSESLPAVLAGAVLTAFSSASLAQPKTIAVRCAHFPPACMEQGGPGPGFLVEVGAEALTRAGFKPDIRIVPWKRAQEDVKNGTDSIIVYFARTPDRETLYQWIETTNETDYSFATKEGTPPIDTLEQARKLDRIAVPAGSNVRLYLLEHGFSTDKLEEAVLDANIGKLDLGRVPAYFGASITFEPAYRRATGHAPVIGKPIYADKNWVAAGLNFPKDAADKIAEALRTIRTDGTVEKIIAKYK